MVLKVSPSHRGRQHHQALAGTTPDAPGTKAWLCPSVSELHLLQHHLGPAMSPSSESHSLGTSSSGEGGKQHTLHSALCRWVGPDGL